MNIQLEKFLKVYGSDGLQIVAAEDRDSVNEIYTGVEVRRIRPVVGYGVPLGDGLYKLFNRPEDAVAYYNQTFGQVTSSNYVLEGYGIRERIEA